KLTEAPHTTHVGLRDRDGGLWLAEHVATTRGTSDILQQPRTMRLVVNGQRQDLSHYEGRLPVLVAKADHVWLHTLNRSLPVNRLSVWKHGRLIQELSFPETNTFIALFSDGPGSVYAVQPLGIIHLVAKNMDGREHFETERVYSAAVPMGEWFYSDLGLFVVTAFHGGQRQLFTVQLPKSE